MSGKGTPDDPWLLRTPPGTSSYSIYRDETVNPHLLVCTVGQTKLTYLARGLEDLRAMLGQHGDWMALGSADEQKPAVPGTVEAWARATDNPVGGWYGQKNGFRGRFGTYIPPLLEELGWAELEHNPRQNRMRLR